MTRSLDTLGQRLRFARGLRELTQEDLAERVGLKQGDVSKIENGKILQTTAIARLARELRVDALWLELGEGQEPPDSRGDRTSIAHAESFTTRQTPPLVQWGVVQNMVTVPNEFQVELPDNAMAPHAPKGTIATFTRASDPVPGEGLLVLDQRGVMYFRECRLKAGGGWTAYAHNPAFPSLDSVEDGLRVVAHFAGMRSSWSQIVR